MNKIIILLGQRVRCGSNFVGSTLSLHPDVVTLPLNSSSGEFNLFRNREIMDGVYNFVSKNSSCLNVNNSEQEYFMRAYGSIWLKILIRKFNIPSNKVIFIKSPIIENIDLWRAAFPDSKIVIIYRDGRDNVISSVKASNDNRNWFSLKIKLKKRINFYFGRSFINHTKHWALTARTLIKIKEDKYIKKIKYEDLINSEEQLIELFNYYELKYDKSIVEKCLGAPVMGSSFGLHSKNISKPNWAPDNDKSKYVFINRWKGWGILKKIVFKKLAGKELIKLKFENNNNW